MWLPKNGIISNFVLRQIKKQENVLLACRISEKDISDIYSLTHQESMKMYILPAVAMTTGKRGHGFQILIHKGVEISHNFKQFDYMHDLNMNYTLRLTSLCTDLFFLPLLLSDICLESCSPCQLRPVRTSEACKGMLQAQVPGKCGQTYMPTPNKEWEFNVMLLSGRRT